MRAKPLSRPAVFTRGLVAPLGFRAAACGGATMNQDTDQDTSPPEEDSQQLAALVAQAVQKTYGVTYDVSRTDGDLTSEGTLTYYFKPPKVRFDSNLTTDGQPSRTRSIFLEGTIISCQQPMERWLCTSTETPARPSEERVPAEVLARLDEHNITRASLTLLKPPPASS